MAKNKNIPAETIIATPEKVINALIKNSEDRLWAINKITAEGPPHKQLQHSLVLKRLEKLLAIYKKNNGSSIKAIKGNKLISFGPEHETSIPVDLPNQSLEGIEDIDGLIEKISKGPEHELLYTALLLQVIEFMISTESAK